MTTTTRTLPPMNLKQWVEEHKDELKPPVGNKYLYRGEDFFIMVVGGPNARNDFHVTASEEFFYQVKGDIVVRIREDDKIIDYTVKEGETFFIPPHVPHSPQRGPGTIGVVVERNRPPGELEHLQFYCEGCGDLVHDLEFDLKDIVVHFRQMMEEFWANDEQRTCGNCGKMVERPEYD
jgi:3-hydroxyanthranilate 3,4-dioxygenase